MIPFNPLRSTQEFFGNFFMKQVTHCCFAAGIGMKSGEIRFVVGWETLEEISLKNK